MSKIIEYIEREHYTPVVQIIHNGKRQAYYVNNEIEAEILIWNYIEKEKKRIQELENSYRELFKCTPQQNK